jgi:murein L,D-transpeptidase YafK
MFNEDTGSKQNYFNKQVVISKLLDSLKISSSAYSLRMEAFKQEKTLNVYLKGNDTDWRLARTYPFCSFSGDLGPKIREGDGQIPEGIYQVEVFNPKSKFYLSLGLNYPTDRDLLLADPQDPGSDIYIHGGCKTVGCIPITDEKMAELYLLAKGASSDIEVVILPFKQTIPNSAKYYTSHPQWKFFWEKLFQDVRSLRK